MAAGPPVAIALQSVTKRFGGHDAVQDVSVDIADGEFFSLLGPSGCGKTTTLRMIAGFERPDSGRIVLQGADVTDVNANKRPLNMVFQQYALFPHMSIYDNIAFGLKVKGVPRSEHRSRIDEMLRVVSLEGYEKRKPRQLSGGQQQRVALARALVNRPAALLLDEPLGALDVYVTHDQEEALAMSDRIAVMNGGRIEQIGAPREIYEKPASAFVADFIGSLNTIEVRVDEVVGGFAVMRLGDGDRIVVPTTEHRAGDTFQAAVRPERVQVDAAASDGGSEIHGTVAELVYLGMYTQVGVDTSAGRLFSHRLADEVASLEEGARITLTWDAEHTAPL
jgi:spermidine/putrescine transport system ATP-binding protein